MLGLSNAMTSGSHHEQQYSLLLDGTDDHLDIGDNLDVGTNNFSISLWFKADAFESENDYIFSKFQNADNRIDIFLGNTQKINALAVGGGDTIFHCVGGTAINPGLGSVWVHVLVSCDRAGNTVLYINGVTTTYGDTETTDNSTGQTLNNTASINIGGLSTGGSNFPGKVDDVAIFNVAIDSDAALAIYNSGKPFDLNYDRGNYDNSSALQGYWRMFNGPFDDKQNGAVHDAHNPGFATGNVLEGGTWVNATGGWSTTTGGIVNSGTNGNFRVQGWGSTSNLNTIYQLSYTLSNVTDSDSLAGKFGSDSGGSQSIPGTAGYHTVYLKNTDSSVDNFQFISTHDWAGTITNISLRRLNGYPGRTSADATFSTDTPDD